MGIYMSYEVNYQPPIKAEVTIDDADISMEVDSGASRSIISEITYQKLWRVPPPLTRSNIKLVTITREELKVLGLTNVRVRLGHKEAQCELLVVAGNTPSLLGRN